MGVFASIYSTVREFVFGSDQSATDFRYKRYMGFAKRGETYPIPPLKRTLPSEGPQKGLDRLVVICPDGSSPVDLYRGRHISGKPREDNYISS